MSKSQGKNIKYPENQRYRKVLKYGDVQRLAEIAGYSSGSVYMILRGERPATMHFQKAFLEFMKEKEALEQQVEEVIGKDKL